MLRADRGGAILICRPFTDGDKNKVIERDEAGPRISDPRASTGIG